MSTIKFPYQYKTIEFGKIIDPMVNLAVKTGEGWREFKFLVDSGADATTLPISLADYLGIRLDRRKKIKIGGIAGEGVVGYAAQVPLRFGEAELTVRCFFIESEVIPLLGRTDVFDRFRIIFDYQTREVIFSTGEGSPHDQERCRLCRWWKTFLGIAN